MGDRDYLKVLCALKEIPFPVGKKLLIKFLTGSANESINRNSLHKLEDFGSLAGYSRDEIESVINHLIFNRLIEMASIHNNIYFKAYQLSDKGREELESPSLHSKKLSSRYFYGSSHISDSDRQVFSAFDFFLYKYNEEQKKAIVSPKKFILCVAGAGSGKTTTLTKRAEFLARFRSVKQEEILAITFTRKARQEMHKRLKEAGLNSVRVETFNSFCEQALNSNASMIYDKKMDVVSYSDRFKLLRSALRSCGTSFSNVVDLYYSASQRSGKTNEELTYRFINDCFTVLEHYKINNRQITDIAFPKDMSAQKRAAAKLVHDVCITISSLMKQHGLRDYTDQLLHALHLFKEHPSSIPSFSHILIDEYQDINELQIELVKMLNPPNLFCVGDPRQSIFGWRGSKVSYILDFQKNYPDAEVISLVKNYRSVPLLVNLINESVRALGLPDLEAIQNLPGSSSLVSFYNELEEYAYVMDQVIRYSGYNTPLEQIFVLARTNRQLTEISSHLALRKIPYFIREENSSYEDNIKPGHILLGTIHAVKGMEADIVFLIGCNSQYFPCKASDHPVVDLVKEVDYDLEEEERRLFYVGLSRARKHLHLSYTGTLTHFVSPSMKKILAVYDTVNSSFSGAEPAAGSLANGISRNGKTSAGIGASGSDTFEQLRTWRRDLAKKLGIPAYYVLTDSVLIEIAARKPESLEELQSVKGIGPAKLIKYGEELLKIVG